MWKVTGCAIVQNMIYIYKQTGINRNKQPIASYSAIAEQWES